MYDCTFSYISFFLAVAYFLVLGFIIRCLVLLFPQEKRSAQKTFLVFVLLQSLGRVLYFALWPFFGTACEPEVSSDHFHPLDVPATLPAAFFLSGYSVLMYTFARIYHTVLKGPDRVQDRYFMIFVFVIISINSGLYAIMVLDYADPKSTQITAWLISVATLLVAAGFLLYGLLLYFSVQRVLEHSQQRRVMGTDPSEHLMSRNHNDSTSSLVGPPSPHSPHSHQTHSHAQPHAHSSAHHMHIPISPAHEHSESVQKNPMKNIAVVACFSVVCFLFRVILLPIMVSLYGLTWLIALVYFGFSEIIPLCMMLKIFDTKATSGTHARQAFRPAVLLSPRRSESQ